MLYALSFFILTWLVLSILSNKSENSVLEINEFLGYAHTSICRGLAIILVVTMHLGAGVFGSRLFTPLGGIGVALFLICSGYGLSCSFAKCGTDGFFKKRASKVLVPYWISMILACPLVISSGGGYTELVIKSATGGLI